MTKTKITAAKQEEIETLIRKGRKVAESLRWSTMDNLAQSVDDLVDVAERYLEEVK